MKIFIWDKYFHDRSQMLSLRYGAVNLAVLIITYNNSKVKYDTTLIFSSAGNEYWLTIGSIMLNKTILIVWIIKIFDGCVILLLVTFYESNTFAHKWMMYFIKYFETDDVNHM